jgi:hypothetical protein
MPWTEIMKLLRSLSAEIGRLQRLGDQCATAVMAHYVYAYNHPMDEKANMNLRRALEDYIDRDLRDAEVAQLGDRFGHRLPESEKEHGPRIVVPDTGRAQ